MWDTYFGSRSLENCCFVAGINRVGTEDDCYMFGNNKIYNYRGHLLAEAPVDDEFCWYKPWIWTMWPITGQRMFPICRIAGWKPIKSSRRCIDRLKITAG